MSDLLLNYGSLVHWLSKFENSNSSESGLNLIKFLLKTDCIPLREQLYSILYHWSHNCNESFLLLSQAYDNESHLTLKNLIKQDLEDLSDS